MEVDIKKRFLCYKHVILLRTSYISLLLQINVMYTASFRSKLFITDCCVAVHIKCPATFNWEFIYLGTCKWNYITTECFSCTVACTSIRAADKTDKATETPGSDLLSNCTDCRHSFEQQGGGGGGGWSVQCACFLPLRFLLRQIQEEEFLIKHRLYILNEQICKKMA